MRPQEKRGKGERVEGKRSARRNPTGRGGSPRFCRILFFPLSQEGVASQCRDMAMSKDEAAIAQALYKLSAYPLAGASRRGKHGTLSPRGRFLACQSGTLRLVGTSPRSKRAKTHVAP